ncbi:general secretion pathway protein D [Pseudomonas cuatrocienegasensis]|uniref:General secretion pathway protein D n=1 Tax=Pseudomonas cuatrocienegasensis TaxID=543360 RepID=A0ABY1BDH2_9PSED|nr:MULTISPECIES: type II secretion system secretin GspD [Pseudomonas]SEQ59762.1 general secretion pathway protein D [Pseudomonas cuatrocienegasensis]
MAERPLTSPARVLRSLLLGLLLPALAVATEDGHTPAEPQHYEVNFVDTNISEFIDSVSRITGTTFIVDPRVQGKVTVRTMTRHTPEEIYDIFLAQLRAQGFAAVDLPDGSVKILPDQVARLEPVPVETGQRLESAANGMATRVFSVRNAASEQMLEIIKPLVDPRVGVITPYPSANLLVVTDWRSNLSRIESLLRQLDQVIDEPVETLPLQHASARDTARLVNELLGKDNARSAKVVADVRGNALLVRGSTADRERVRQLLKQLDMAREHVGNTEVVYLRHANAADVLKVLRGLSQGGVAEAAVSADGAAAPAAVSVDGVRLEAEEGANAIVMLGPDSELMSYRQIIERLDIRRAQVVVEAIIVEVSDTRAQELGVQWLFLDPDSNLPAGGVNFNGNGAGINAIAAAAATGNNTQLGSLLSSVEGVTAGVGHIGGGINFIALLNALRNESGFNLLSTPTLVTLDNAEASILVGQEVPFVTGSITQNNANPYQTIERREVGVKLRLRPQINIDNTVRLDIIQEVSSIADSARASDVITNKREIKTTVMVEDNGMVVLGGLISDEVAESDQRVPLLGDLPLLGRLFRSNARSHAKQNLMVFIRPRIVRDALTLGQLSDEKYRNIKATSPLALPDRETGSDLLGLFPSSRARLGGLIP